MKANELRIGNWVKIGETNTCVICIFETSCELLIGSRKRSTSLFEVKPIPLTTEILEKCGFKTPEMYQDTVKFKDGVMLDLHRGKILLRDNDRIELMYLHQLQNLYFALTGEELEVKL